MIKEKLTIEEVKHVAKLANLELTIGDIEKFTKQMGDVIDYNVALLNQVDTENVEPLYLVFDEINRTREDTPEPSLTPEQVLKNAASEHNGFFKVKAILENT